MVEITRIAELECIHDVIHGREASLALAELIELHLDEHEVRVADDLEDLMGAVGVDEEYLDRVAGVALGASGTSEVEDAVESVIEGFVAEGLGGVLGEEGEAWVVVTGVEVGGDAGDEDAHDGVLHCGRFCLSSCC